MCCGSLEFVRWTMDDVSSFPSTYSKQRNKNTVCKIYSVQKNLHLKSNNFVRWTSQGRIHNKCIFFRWSNFEKSDLNIRNCFIAQSITINPLLYMVSQDSWRTHERTNLVLHEAGGRLRGAEVQESVQRNRRGAWMTRLGTEHYRQTVHRTAINWKKDANIKKDKQKKKKHKQRHKKGR